MQKIAKEMNLSETAFVLRSKVADFRARYFTPAEEIPLAGHPTISTVQSLVESGIVRLGGARTELTLELKAGVISIEIHDGDRPSIVMSQRKPEFLRTHEPAVIAKLFGLEVSDLLADVPIQTVSTGTPQLMVPVKNHSVLKKAQMNVPEYIAYQKTSDFFSPHLFCLTGMTSEGATFARHFGVPPDTAEDPFTGSATGGMAAYLWHYGLIDTPKFIAEQGHWMGRPGRAKVEVIGSRTDIATVKVGGQAGTVIRGQIEI
jgi:trans-2,3-dihydro-3-hydroxyanthranilate isomerase